MEKVDHSEAIKIPGQRKGAATLPHKPGFIRDQILQGLVRAGGTADIDEILMRTTGLTRAQIGQNLYNMVRVGNATQPGPSTYSITDRGRDVLAGNPVGKAVKVPAKRAARKTKDRKTHRDVTIDNGTLPMGTLLQVVGITKDGQLVVAAVETGRTYKTEAL